MSFEPSSTGSYYQRTFPVGEGQTDYEKYLRTQELLSLQRPLEDCVSPEEWHFQVTHQTAELWMKLMQHELDRALAFLAQDKLHMAFRSFRLVSDIQKLLINQVDVLGQHLSIVEYEAIRLALGQGSGMESPGFNRLLEYPARLWEAFTRQLEKRQIDLRTIYRNYEENIELHTLAEHLMDFDDLFHRWRVHHYALVARVIGVDSNSLKGLSTQVLTKGTKHRFFQELLDLRSEITNESSVAYGGQPL